MRTVSLSEAKQKLSALVKRAGEGEQTGITRRGKLVAIITPAPSALNVAHVFADIEEIRERAKPLKGITVKDLIEEGRR